MRSCGDCKVCCTLLGVDSLQKPERTRCSNLCRSGCSAYADRPQECRDYACAWLNGLGPANWRPDRLGVVFDSALDQEIAAYANGHPWMVAREVTPGAFNERRALSALAFVSSRCVTFMAYWDQSKPTGEGRPEVIAPRSHTLPVVGAKE